MDFSLVSGKIAEIESDALVIGRYRGAMTKAATEIDKLSGGALSKWIKDGEATGCLGEVAIFRDIPGIKAKRVAVVGLGKKEDGVYNFEAAIKAALKGVYFAKKIVISADDWLGADKDWIVEKTAQLTIESFEKPADWKSSPAFRWKQPDSISILVGRKTKELELAFAFGVAVGKSIAMAKDVANMPGNLCTPKFMADKCVAIGKSLDIKTTVFDEEALRKLNMGCLLGVSAGSKQPAYMVVMQYNGIRGGAPVALVGKGLTFDAGGISLKPAKSMDEMKYDMGGAISVVAAIAAASALKLPLNIIGVIGCTENLPGGAATKPGDILTSYSGKTVEVLNTDAEGRLVLADLLAYTVDKFKPKAIVDVATLTGACTVALGSEFSGLFSNNEELAFTLLEAGEHCLDRCWRLPLGRSYAKSLRTPFADLANVGARGGSSSVAAAFLESFVGRTPWAHLDIAGTAWTSGPNKGATGRPVALLINYLRTLTY